MSIKKMAIVERVYSIGTAPAFMAEDIFTSKLKLKKHIDFIKRYGTVQLTDIESNDITIKEAWADVDYAFIIYQEKDSSIKVTYRIRMLEVNRYV